MNDFLTAMREASLARAQSAKRGISQESLRHSPFFNRAPLDACAPFQRDDCRVIAEIKFASPSAGDIRKEHDPVPIALSYAQAGAAMLSVLTEPQFFKGSLDYLSAVRAALPAMPLLRKDFIVAPYQLYEARAAGADAVLLILALTGRAQTQDLYAEALSLGLTPLVEVHDEAELQDAADMGACLIGVNNRNLKTLKTDLNVSRALAPLKPDGALFICESGIETAAEVREMRALGFDGFLMGTHFMRHENPGRALSALQEELSCT